MADTDVFNNVISTVNNSTSKPEDFLSVQNAIALNLKDVMKKLYDFTKENTGRNTDALPELLTDGFDEEQIWQQLELQNEGELVHILSRISKLMAGNKEFRLPITASNPKSVKNKDKDVGTIKGVTNVDQGEEEEDEEGEEEEEEEEEEQELKNNSKKLKQTSRNKKKSIVDDKFFKLQELDEYLTKEEKREKQTKKNSDGDDEESLDLFNDLSENDDDDTEDAKLLKYADFFDNPHSEDEGDDTEFSLHSHSYNIGEKEGKEPLRDSKPEDTSNEKENQALKFPVKKVKFNLTNDSDETDSLEYKAETKENDKEIKSSLEARQERLQKKIHELEEEALAEKPWQLKGEVNAAVRPQNSLLEEYVEFDVTTRPAPVITEQTTFKLEDIIKQRIKDKAWDDVEKKFKPVDTPLEYKKKLILNQEKSKESLSQIYENEYLKQKQASNPESQEAVEEEPKKHVEIRESMRTLFSKLDALSNFHYTPKMAQPEIKVISNVPAINMEEVAPVATSDATLLAPEEVKAKPRGDVMDKSERTSTDIKRERRKKKLRQREKQKDREEKEKLNEIKRGVDKKYKKDKNVLLMKKLSKSRNITTVDETSNKATKSSTAFFSQLQDQVKSHIKSKVNLVSKQKRKDALSAVKLKL